MICVIDFGTGNLRSVSKAIEHLGGEVCVSDSPDKLKQADKLILPGVGSFGDAMEELNKRKLTPLIVDHIKSRKYFLGICLGLQLLFDQSEESPNIGGLGIFPGEVKKFTSQDVKIPHMGWNSVEIKDNPVLKDVPNQSYFYFVHTYFAQPARSECVIGSCDYGSDQFAAAVGNDTVFATQFHPEKSQTVGLQILKNFIAL